MGQITVVIGPSSIGGDTIVEAKWGSIGGDIDNQSDLITYVATDPIDLPIPQKIEAQGVIIEGPKYYRLQAVGVYTLPNAADVFSQTSPYRVIVKNVSGSQSEIAVEVGESVYTVDGLVTTNIVVKDGESYEFIATSTTTWDMFSAYTASSGGGGGVSSVTGDGVGGTVSDPVLSFPNADEVDDASTTNKFTTSADITKLGGIEAGAEVNNVSDADASILTDGSDAGSLHNHNAVHLRPYTGTLDGNKEFNMLVTDNGYLGRVSNALGTTDRAAPQEIGEEEQNIPFDAAWQQGSHQGIVRMKQTFTYKQDGFEKQLYAGVSSISLTDTVSRITIENITRGTYQVIDRPILLSDVDVLLRAGAEPVNIGDVVEVNFYLLNTKPGQTIEGGWKREASLVPVAGDWSANSFNLPSKMVFSHVDLDGVNRQTELEGLAIGAIIYIFETGDSSRSVETKVTAVIPNSTYVEYTVDPVGSSPNPIRNGKACSVRMEEPSATPTSYDYLPLSYDVQPNYADVVSELYFDGVLQPEANTTGYRIIEVHQRAEVSNDYQYLAWPSGGLVSDGSSTPSAPTPPPTFSSLLMAASLAASQEPIALDTPLQLEFGPAQVTTKVDLSAAGAITIKEDGKYFFGIRLQFSRTNNNGELDCYFNILKNGVVIGLSKFLRIESSKIGIPVVEKLDYDLLTNDVITFEIVRDSLGSNDGGLYSFTPTLAGRPIAPTASIEVSKFV